MATELDLESLARLQAQLRRPFTAREDVLRAAGLDEAALQAAQAHWSERLAAKEGGPLRDRYSAAFAGSGSSEVSPSDAPPASPVTELAAAPSVAREEEPRAATPRDQRFIPSYMLGSTSLQARPPMPPAPPMLVPMPPATVASPAADPPEVDVDTTQPPLQRRVGSTLPFARGQEVPDAVRAAWADAKAESQSKQRVARSSSTRTLAIDETALLPPSKPGEPPSTPGGGNGPETSLTRQFPLEEYAAFLGELAKDPTRAGILRAKYGIAGEDAQRALGAGFAAKFQADPSQRARFDTLLAVERAKR